VRFWLDVWLATEDEMTGQDGQDQHRELSEDQLRRRLSLIDQQIDSHFNSLLLTSKAIPDFAFIAAFQRVIDAEGPVKQEYTEQEIKEVMGGMSGAQAALNQAAERYIFSAESGESPLLSSPMIPDTRE
jgi:hypothetical protein